MSGLTDFCLVNSSLLRRGKRLLVGPGRSLPKDLLHLLAGVLCLALYICLGLGCAQKHRSRHGSIRSLIWILNLAWRVDLWLYVDRLSHVILYQPHGIQIQIIKILKGKALRSFTTPGHRAPGDASNSD